jgi:hypothetical protein
VSKEIISNARIPTNHNSHTEDGTSEMHFNEFVTSLEKISLVFFYDNHMLITSFDKMEALYQFMTIDDMKVLRVKLKKAEDLATLTLNPIN